MRTLLKKRRFWVGLITGFMIALIYSQKDSPQIFHRNIQRADIRTWIQSLPEGERDQLFRFQKQDYLWDGKQRVVEFTLDDGLQETVEQLLRQFKPDLGAIVALDAMTGRVMAISDFQVDQGGGALTGSLGFEQIFPAASIFKVITAAAALDSNHVEPQSLIEYSGRNHTLYKNQVLKERPSGWRRMCTVREAFAKSINSVFGRMGVFQLGKENLKACSVRFAFDGEIPSDFPVKESQSSNPENSFELAEMASGFTQHNMITPLHGAMIAAASVHQGLMMEPYFIERMFDEHGKEIYRASPKAFTKAMKPETALKLQELMEETVISGTSRKSFRGFFKGNQKDIEVGGKTGSLTDDRLGMKLDWFVGYGRYGGRQVALGILTAHRKYWNVKSSFLARRIIESWYRAPSAEVGKK